MLHVLSKIYSLLFLILISTLCKAQQPTPLVNSGKVLIDGVALHEKGKYKEAIQLYKTVSRSDTNYARVLHEMSFSYYKDSQFNSSLDIAKLGEKLFPYKEDVWLNLEANALDALGKTEEALVTYDKIIALNPYSYLGPYNKAICYYNQKKLTEAKPLFQKAAVLNPYYSKVHFYLGRIALNDGNLTAAMLSFMTNLALNPEGDLSASVVTNLTNIANTKDEILTNANNYKQHDEDNFELIQDIILSKASLDKKYKLKTSLEDPICRQMQVILEKLEFNKDDKGFWMQYYAPFYTKLFAEDRFNMLVNFMFSGLKIKSVDEFEKHNKKEVEEYINFERKYFSTIREAQVLNYTDRVAVKEHYYIENGLIDGKGSWLIDNTGNKKFFGPWEFYHENGKLKSKGTLNSDEKKEGYWEYYYNNGIISEKCSYINNEPDGKCTTWHDNGNLSEELNYKKGLFDGEQKYYYYNGLIHTIQNYKQGKKDGIQQSYKTTGELDFVVHYNNDVQDQAYTYYHSNGKIASITKVKDSKANGTYKKFDENGTVIMEGTYENDLPNGNWKTYYPSGKLKESYSFINGLQDGEYKEYFENSKLSEQNTYVKGKIDGEDISYNQDGKLYIKSQYERGRLRELKYFDNTEKEIYSVTTRNGSGNFVFYDMYGNKTVETHLTKEGDKDGKATYYFKNGKQSEIDTYKKGSLEGEKLTYYPNGTLHEKTNFNNNEEDGFYTAFHENGKPSYSGWMVAGKRQGEHKEFNTLGTISSNINYKNNDLDGYYEVYNCNGKKSEEYFYDEGWLKRITDFDSTGNVLTEVNMPDGNAEVSYVNADGKVYGKTSYKHFFLNGLFQFFFFDGSVRYVATYLNGKKEGPSKEYFYGGKIQNEGAFKAGEKEGLWKYYYADGQLQYQENYTNGKINGKVNMLNEAGWVERELNYTDNLLEGEYKVFGENGELALLVNYKKNIPISFTYYDKDGKLVNPIPFVHGAALEKAYYKNGNPSVEINIEENTVNGIRKIYYTNGKPFIEGQRIFGKENGIKRVYYNNAQVEIEDNYELDEKNGLCRTWYANGKIKSEEYYVAGDLYGDCKYYDDKGIIKETRKYYCGSLVSVKKL